MEVENTMRDHPMMTIGVVNHIIQCLEIHYLKLAMTVVNINVTGSLGGRVILIANYLILDINKTAVHKKSESWTHFFYAKNRQNIYVLLHFPIPNIFP